MSFDGHVVVFKGPSFHLDLAALDARHPVHYSRRLTIFRCTSGSQREAQVNALKVGLQSLVSRCPVLGGTVVPLPPEDARDGKEDWRTIVPGPGLELVVQDLRKAIPSYEKLEASDFDSAHLPYDLLVPVPSDLGNDRPFAACKVQFSAIEGGTIITFAMSHSVADGSGTNELMRILSEETRLAQDRASNGAVDEDPAKPAAATVGLDRSPLLDVESDIPFNIEDHPAYMWTNPRSGETASSDQASARSFEATSPEVAVHMRISAEGLTRLKADATAADSPPISTHDALSALIWRTVLLVRSRRAPLSEDVLASTTGTVFMPSDARRHLGIPTSYVGNAVYQLVASLDLGTLLSPSGLKHGASALRRAIKAVRPELVASYMVMTAEKWVDWQFMTTYATTGAAMGTDWTSGTLYEQDWGEAFGPMIRFRYPGGGGYNAILPKLPDGAAEVVVGVMPGEVDVVKGSEGFGKYLEVR